MQEFWNKRYLEATYAYGEHPNEFFRGMLRLQSGTKLLLPADGEGRNGVYAASLGWKVTAFDYSQSAVDKALQLAAKKNVSIDFQLADVRSFDYPTEYYDVAGLIFVHLPSEMRIHLHQNVIQCLRPGGKIILEAFAKEQLGNPSGGPKNLDLLYDQETIQKDFAELNILQLERRQVWLDEGPYHQGKAEVVRMLAEK